MELSNPSRLHRCWLRQPAFAGRHSRWQAQPMAQVGYGSALSGAHYLVLSTESLRVVIEPVA